MTSEKKPKWISQAVEDGGVLGENPNGAQYAPVYILKEKSVSDGKETVKEFYGAECDSCKGVVWLDLHFFKGRGAPMHGDCL